MNATTPSLSRTSGHDAQMSPAQQRKIVFAAVIGNLLEFFDFTVYSYFALTIGKQFFPSNDPITSSLFAFAVFAIGFVMRQLGGIVLGRYADRAGRKPALTLTILLMAIGLAPAYAQIGLAAPILIVVARLVQGFAQGDEFGAATATLLEMGGAKSRGFRASWQLASQGAGALLGSGLAASLGFLLSDDTMHSWGWRIPFLMGTLIAPVGIYLRRHIQEEAPAAKAVATRDDPKRGLRAQLVPHDLLDHGHVRLDIRDDVLHADVLHPVPRPAIEDVDARGCRIQRDFARDVPDLRRVVGSHGQHKPLR